MVTLQSARPLVRMYEYRPLISPSLGRLKPANVAVNNAIGPERSCGGWGFCCDAVTTSFLQPFKAATSNCSAIHGTYFFLKSCWILFMKTVASKNVTIFFSD